VPSYKSSDAVEQERYVQVNVVQTAMPRLMMRETYGVSSLDGRRLGLVSSAKRQTPQSSVGAYAWGVDRASHGQVRTRVAARRSLGRCPVYMRRNPHRPNSRATVGALSYCRSQALTGAPGSDRCQTLTEAQRIEARLPTTACATAVITSGGVLGNGPRLVALVLSLLAGSRSRRR
jgi:hypothetical protein